MTDELCVFYNCDYWDENKMKEIVKTYFARNIEQVLETAAYKAAALRPPTTHHENYQN